VGVSRVRAGAGWIRVNTADGTALITGTVSPATSVDGGQLCASVGHLQR
jgi:hypothetical protein